MTDAKDDAKVDPPVVDADPTDDEAKRNAEDDNKGKLIASLQEKAARVNTAEREAAEAKAEVERLRRASPVPAPQIDTRQQQLRETFAWAQGKDGQAPDPVAATAINVAIENERIRLDLAERDALDEIDDNDLRKQVKKALKSNPDRLGGAGDVKAAMAELQASRASELQEEVARLNEALRVAQEPTGKAPPTLHREVPASVLKARTFETLEEFDNEKKGLSTLERLKLEEQIDSRKVNIKR